VGGDWQLQEQAWWMMPYRVKIVSNVDIYLPVTCYVCGKVGFHRLHKPDGWRMATSEHLTNAICLDCYNTPAPTEADDAARYYGQADAV
jgi:hypothetical protein